MKKLWKVFFLIDFLKDLLKNSRKIVEGISEGFELKESWEIKNKKKSCENFLKKPLEEFLEIKYISVGFFMKFCTNL